MIHTDALKRNQDWTEFTYSERHTVMKGVTYAKSEAAASRLEKFGFVRIDPDEEAVTLDDMGVIKKDNVFLMPVLIEDNLWECPVCQYRHHSRQGVFGHLNAHR